MELKIERAKTLLNYDLQLFQRTDELINKVDFFERCVAIDKGEELKEEKGENYSFHVESAQRRWDVPGKAYLAIFKLFDEDKNLVYMPSYHFQLLVEDRYLENKDKTNEDVNKCAHEWLAAEYLEDTHSTVLGSLEYYGTPIEQVSLDTIIEWGEAVNDILSDFGTVVIENNDNSVKMTTYLKKNGALDPKTARSVEYPLPHDRAAMIAMRKQLGLFIKTLTRQLATERLSKISKK